MKGTWNVSRDDQAIDVHVDQELCVGHGRCLLAAPEVFGYDDVTNLAFVLPDANPSEHRDAVYEAASGCPESAIIVNG